MASGRTYLLFLQYLLPKELLESVELVSKTFRKHAVSDELWTEFLAREFGNRSRSDGTAKEEFRYRTYSRCLVHVFNKQDNPYISFTHIPSFRRREFQLSAKYTFCSVCWLWTGDLLLTGGQSDGTYSRAAARLNAATFALQEVDSMRGARMDHSAVARYPSVYVFGGYNGHSISTCEKLGASGWSQFADMNTPRRNFTPAVVRKWVYLAGGSETSVERFDIDTETFGLCGVKLEVPYASVLALSHSDAVVFLHLTDIAEFTVDGGSGDLRAGRKGQVPLLDWRGSGDCAHCEDRTYFLLTAHSQLGWLQWSSLNVVVKSESVNR